MGPEKIIEIIVVILNLLKEATEATVSVAKGVSEVEKLREEGKKVDPASGGTEFQTLKTYGRDLVEEAVNFDPVIGRDEEIQRVIEILCRRTKNNPVLIGEPGVGKTAVVEGVAQRIVRGDVPSNLQDIRLIALDIGALVAGAKYRGDFEDRIKSLLKEVEDAQGKVVLFIDEIHLVLGAGRIDGPMDAANLFKPMLARGQLSCIGATTLKEYRNHVEKDAAFERLFQQVHVAEPSVAVTISILRGLKEKYEGHHNVRILDKALVVATQLSSRYITERYLPDKAIDLVDGACASVRAGETCASVREHLDSLPEEIDTLERKKIQLEAQLHTLEKKKEKASEARLVEVHKKLDDLGDMLESLKMEYRKAKERLDGIGSLKLDDLKDTSQLLKMKCQKAKEGANKSWSLKQKRKELLSALQEAERRKDLARVADIRYGALEELEIAITKHEAAMGENDRLTESVGPEQIAEVH